MSSIKSNLNLIKLLDLERPPIFDTLFISEIEKVYNGAGPDWMSEFSRSVLTMLLRYYAPAFIIHDVEFAMNDDTENTDRNWQRFEDCNDRMWRNIQKLNAYIFAWYNPRKYWWLAKGWLAYQACGKFGFSAWCATEPEHNIAVLSAKKELEEK